MRHKDEAKQDAIIKATIKLVNDIGFAATSVSKIAKEAGVSPATLYIYYENKEDLLVSTYVQIKQKLGEAIGKNIDDTKPIREVMRDFWFKAFRFISKFPGEFQYAEQFANSPYSSLVDKTKVEKYFDPMVKVIQRGIEQKILKDVSFEMFQIFAFFPVTILANPRIYANFNCSDINIEKAFDMAWDAIKL
jgi:AcrR family transcriptional regulator